MAEGSSSEDRERLRERVRARLDATERSQRQLETELGWSSGTLTRVFGGRKQLDREMLVQLAQALELSAASLIEGTGFADLVEVLPEAPAEDATGPEPEPETPSEAPAPPPEPEPEPEPEVEPEPTPVTEAEPTPTPVTEAEPEPTPVSEPEITASAEPSPSPNREPVTAATPAVPDAEAETEAFSGQVPPEDAPTEVDRRAAADSEATGTPSPPPADDGAPAEEAATEAPGGVRGWLRSLARRVFGTRQG